MRHHYLNRKVQNVLLKDAFKEKKEEEEKYFKDL